MRARCVSVLPTAQQAKLLGKNFVAGRTEYPIHEGREYTILGLGCWDGVIWYEIAASQRLLVSVPSFLFEITSGRVSRHWETRAQPNGVLTLWPQSFYHPYYHDHLSEGQAEAMEDFRHLLTVLEQEAQG
jgi:hypothetical protein